MASFADLVDSEGSSGFDGFGGLGSGSLRMEGDPLQRQLSLVDRYTALAEQYGIPSEQLEPRESLFSKVLNTLDKPKQTVLGLLDAGLIRGDLGKVGVLGAMARGLDERANWFDILRREGTTSPWTRGIVGFAGEVLTDPLTYLTLGGAAVKNLPKAGGRALTEKGVEVQGKLYDLFSAGRLALPDKAIDAAKPVSGLLSNVEQGLRSIGADDAVEDAFRAIGGFVDATKVADNAKNPWVAKLAQADSFKQFERAKPILEALGVSADDAMDIFAKKQIAIGVNLPFLGHLTGKNAQVATDLSRSSIKKAARAVGKFINPDSVTLFKSEFPETASNIIQQFTYSTAKAIDAVAKSDVPVVSQAGKVAKFAKDTTNSIIEGSRRIFNQTFNLEGALGKNAALARGDLLNAEQANKFRARVAAEALYGELKNAPDIRRSIALGIDDLTSNIFDDLLADPQQKTMFFSEMEKLVKSGVEVTPDSVANVMDVIQKSLTGLTVNGTNKYGGIQKASDMIEEMFIDKLAMLKQGWVGDPKALDYLDRTISAMQDLRRTEAAEGVGSSIIEHYIPHVVTTLRKKMGGGAKAANNFFNKERKYSSFRELLEQGGHLANTDIAEVFYQRMLASQNLIAEKRYLERVMFETSTDPEVLKEAFKAATLGDSAAYDALKVKGFDLPRNLDESQIEGLIATKTQSRNYSPGLQRLLNLDSAKGLPVQEQVKVIDALRDITNETRVKAMALGLKPDATVPLSIFGEAAVKRSLKGKDYWLSPTVARAVDDVLEKQGPIERLAANNELFSKMLKASDTTVNWFKGMVTIPWPAYWSQNILGDGLRRALNQSIGVANPASYAEIHSVLNGTASLVTPLGKITPEMFHTILRDYGVRMTYKDFVGIIDDLGKVNIETIEKQSRSFGQNIKRLELATAAGKSAEKLQDMFEDFMRIQQLAHELKKGSTISSAVKSMNDVMFNYRDLTRFEASVFRRFYMFYPWLKKSTAYTMTQLFTQPGALSNQIRAARGIAETFSDPNAIPTFEERDAELLKDIVQREQIAFPLGLDKDGNQVTGRGFGLPLNTMLQQFTVQIPRSFDWSELLNTADASAVRTLQKQFASANPWVNMFVQKLSGKNMYFDKPLDAKFIRTLPKMASVAEKIGIYPYTSIPVDLMDAATREFLGGVDNGKGGYIVDPNKFFYLVNVIPGMSRLISTANRFANEDLPVQQALTHFLTGIRVDPTDAQRTRVAEVVYNLRSQLEAHGVYQQLENARSGL